MGKIARQNKFWADKANTHYSLLIAYTAAKDKKHIVSNQNNKSNNDEKK